MRWFHGAVLVAASATFARAGDDTAAPPVAQHEGRSAAEWTSDLASEDVKLRQKAAYALFKMGPEAKSAAAALVKAIRDADPYVRTTSASAVAKLGADVAKPVVAEIASEMSDERPEVRREAASLLWRLGPLAADVVPELTKALASDDELVRANAVGDTAWSEWRWEGTQTEGGRLDMAGVIVLGLREDRVAWARLYVEPVEQQGAGIEAAVRDMTAER